MSKLKVHIPTTAVKAKHISKSTISSNNKTLEVSRTEFEKLSTVVKKLKQEFSLHTKQALKFSDIEYKQRVDSLKEYIVLYNNRLSQLENNSESRLNELEKNIIFKINEHNNKYNEKILELSNNLERLEFKLLHYIKNFNELNNEKEILENNISTLKSTYCEENYNIKEEIKKIKGFIDLTDKKYEVCKKKIDMENAERINEIEIIKNNLNTYRKEYSNKILEIQSNINKKLLEYENMKNRHSSILYKTLDDIIYLREHVTSIPSMKQDITMYKNNISEYMNKDSGEKFEMQSKIVCFENKINENIIKCEKRILQYSTEMKQKINTLATVLENLLDIIREEAKENVKKNLSKNYGLNAREIKL